MAHHDDRRERERIEAAGAGSTTPPPRRRRRADPEAADRGPADPALLPQRGRQEVGDGRHRRHPHGLRARPPDRQPQALPLEGGDQPLRRGAARHARRTCCRARCCSGRIRIVLDRRVRVPHPLRVRADAASTAGPGPRPTGTSRSATTSPPTTRRARCAGPASSSSLFLVFHLVDLTWGNANTEFVRGDPYNNLVYSFQRPAVAIVYIVANIALGVPPVPRRLVDVPEHGHQQPALQQVAPAVRAGLRRGDPRRQPQLPDRGAAARRSKPRVPAHDPTTEPCPAADARTS